MYGNSVREYQRKLVARFTWWYLLYSLSLPVITVRFSQTSYTVTERLEVEVCAVVDTLSTECITNFPFNVSLYTSPSSGMCTYAQYFGLWWHCIFKHVHSPARDPADYQGVSNATLSFGPCQERSCLRIPTANNFEVEMDEIFFVYLRVAPGQDSRISISPSRSQVVIKDNDGEQLLCTIR